MSKLIDQLQGAERERVEREKAAEQVATVRVVEEKRALDLARERQAAEVELRRLAHARAEAEAKMARLVAERERAEAHALNLSRASGRPFVSAYNDAAVIAGGGTTALEMLEDVADADAIIVPVGGGGLIGGVGVWAKHARPGIRVIGVQSEASPALHAALTAGRLVSVPVEESLADGLAGKTEAGCITLPLTQAVVDEVALVREADIADAMRWLAAEHHVLVEGSAATALAALLAGRVANLAGRRVVLLLTGRNVTYEVMAQVFAQDVPA